MAAVSLTVYCQNPERLDSMSNSKQFVIRWAGTTLGYTLSDGEELLHGDDNAIIIGQNGRPSRLIATYSFSPNSLSPGLRLELLNLKTAILRASGYDAVKDQYHAIPDWLASLSQIEMLVLSNADLSNIGTCKDLPLKYLDLRKVYCSDKSSVLAFIGNLGHLEIFVHDETFSVEDLAVIQAKLPNLKFASKN